MEDLRPEEHQTAGRETRQESQVISPTTIPVTNRHTLIPSFSLAHLRLNGLELLNVPVLDLFERRPEPDATTPLAHPRQFALQQLPLFQQFVGQFFLLLEWDLFACVLVVPQSPLEVVQFELVGVDVEPLDAGLAPTGLLHLVYDPSVKVVELLMALLLLCARVQVAVFE